VLDRLRAAAVERVPAELQGRLFRAVPKRLLGRVESASRYGDLDLPRCRALSDEMNYAATLHLAVPEAERARAAEELRELLLVWEVDGHRPVQAVYRREELYEGPCVARSPDLVLQLALREGYSYTLLPSLRAAPGQTWRRLRPEEHVGGKGLGMNGSHRQHGLLMLWGQGIRAGARIEAGMADIAPTLLHLLGEAVPEHMDGRVLTEALADERTQARAVVRAAWRGSTPQEHATGAAETEAIRRRLQGLGYL